MMSWRKRLGRRYSPRRFQRAVQSFQQIWNATAVFPVPVAFVTSIRPAAENTLHDAVDGDLLIVTLALAHHMVEGCKQLSRRMRIRETGADAVTPPELIRGRIVGPSLLQPGCVVELADLVPVGRVGELQSEHAGIVLRLL